MNKIVFATCNEMPALQPSDMALAAALEARGGAVAPAPWNGPFAPFDAADLVVVRSTWDYPQFPDAFAAWLDALGRVKGQVANAPSLMTWNMRKTYLLELSANRSIRAKLPPTRLAEPNAQALMEAMEVLSLDEAVVKPIIGATASGLSIIRRDDPDGAAKAGGVLGQSGLVQPLISEIRTLGETSMMYFAGDYSHAVVKRAKAGSILVQEEHGGISTSVQPPAWAIEEGRRILSLLPSMPVYARVDVVILDESLLLMEVELIEPELFFTHDGAAAGRLADVLMRELKE